MQELKAMKERKSVKSNTGKYGYQDEYFDGGRII